MLRRKNEEVPRLSRMNHNSNLHYIWIETIIHTLMYIKCLNIHNNDPFRFNRLGTTSLIRFICSQITLKLKRSTQCFVN